MSEPVYLDKAKVVEALRARQKHARAQWVDRELPGLIDAGKNYALLDMLGIDLDAVIADRAADRGSPVAAR